ncbi:hypothetical protein SDC9_128612 [bioreactor metagenome]|uniref:Helix-turn-helix domain-containing protein n=1 Tax=bioreactor metagenome TaxID=1076179 RepID=A0A645CXJ2_9ZZZZ|nr:helix-turn-helix domain-containing protein [Christensenella sp.]
MQNVHTYTVNEIKSILRISRATAYHLVNDPPFPVVKVGSNIRIPKEAFDHWLMGA